MNFKFIFNKSNYQLYKNYNLTIIQIAELIGIVIPRFCYHNSLSIAGNCRMCLIEVNTSVKPIVACGFTVTNNLIINTNTKKVSIIRESILEFLLINHPLDCPICDSAGECDLQDISLLFGNDLNKFKEKKRIVSDKNFGKFIKTIMTRCIHCTRCIRFIDEYLYQKQGHIGTLGRGTNTIVSNYFNSNFEHDLSGNLADICPVGALTHKTYAFTARPWELNSIEYIDFIENLNMNIRIDLKGNDIYRIIPIYTKNINEEFISNKTRYFYDSYFNNINTEKVYYIYNNNFFKYNKEISWNKLTYQLLKIKKNKMKLDVDTNDIYTAFILKIFYLINDIQYFHAPKNANLRTDYLLNSNIFHLTNKLFLFFINLNIESTIFYLKTKKLNINLYQVGLNTPFNNQKLIHIGLSNNAMYKLIQGRSIFSSKILNSFFNQGLVNKELNINQLKNKYLNLNYYFNSTQEVNTYELGYYNHYTKQNKLIDLNNIQTVFEINKNNIEKNNNNTEILSKIIQNNLNINSFIANKNTNVSSKLLIPSINLFSQYFTFFNLFGELKNNVQILKTKGFDDLTLISFFIEKKIIYSQSKNLFDIIYRNSQFNILTDLMVKKTTESNLNVINTINKLNKNQFFYLNTLNFYLNNSLLDNHLYTKESKYLKNNYIYYKLYKLSHKKTYLKNYNCISYKNKTNHLKSKNTSHNFYDYFKSNKY